MKKTNTMMLKIILHLVMIPVLSMLSVIMFSLRMNIEIIWLILFGLAALCVIIGKSSPKPKNKQYETSDDKNEILSR